MKTSPEPVLEHQSPEARLMATEAASVVGPADLGQPPVIEANPAAVSAYADLAVVDAARPGFDISSPKPVQPSARLVVEAAQTPLVRLGERFQAFYARYSTGLLGHVVPEPVTSRQVLKAMWPYLFVGVLVLASAITVEVIYGSAAADLLARNTHSVSLTAAIAATVVLNGGAWFFADIAHRHHPHLARSRGAWIAVVGFAGIVIVVTCLGLVLGGWDPLQIGTDIGGGEITTAVPEVDHRWLLAATYIALVLLATFVTAVGHYLVIDTYEDRYMYLYKTRERAAIDASLSLERQRELGANLAQAYLDMIPTAEQQVRIRLESYNTTFARHISPELNDVIAPLGYTPTTPLWVVQAHHLVGADATTADLRDVVGS